MNRDLYAELLAERFGHWEDIQHEVWRRPQPRDVALLMDRLRHGARSTTGAVHVYQPDAALPTDHKGRRPCTCGLAAANRIHQVPVVDDEVSAVEARRLGESGGTG